MGRRATAAQPARGARLVAPPSRAGAHRRVVGPGDRRGRRAVRRAHRRGAPGPGRVRLAARPRPRAPGRPSRGPSGGLVSSPGSQRFDLRGRSLRVVAARGTLVNSVFLVALAALGLLRGVILARFLEPDDYGIWGVLIISLGTLLWLKQVGIGDKYIQQDDPDQQLAFQKAFTLELAFTALFTLVLAGAIPVIAVTFAPSEIVLPGYVLLCVMPALVLQAPLWIYYRRLEFLKQRLLQAVDPLVSFVVAIALAIAGAGYWALVLGVVAGGWASAIVSVRSCPYPLRLRYDRGTLRSYASFSIPLLLASGSAIVIAQGTITATTAHLGIAAAGVVTLAASISQFADRVDQIVSGTLYPAICAVADRTEVLQEVFTKANRIALLWAAPFGLGLAVFAGDLVHFVLGQDRWGDAIPVLEAFGVAAAINHLGFNWDSILRARDDTRPMAVAAGLTLVAFLVVTLPLILLEGLEGLAVGFLVQTVVVVLARFWFLRRIFPAFRTLAHCVRAFAPALVATAVTLGLRLLDGASERGLVTIAELATFVAATAVATVALERDLVREARGYLRRD
ncbi:oligosaccharide flippase family protein [Conexibacter sp. W3-3-2]|nr:oligosaccharide flippase family protein [Conexibacter sp. W3-3-2]